MAEMSGLSSSDVLALTDRNDMFGGSGGAFFWVFALLLLNNGGFGNNNGNFAAQLADSQNAQTAQLQLQAIQQELGQNKFDVAQIVNAQTDTLINQNNANLINAIQGFNNLGLQITNQTNVLSSQIQALSAQNEQCCCKILTQMLNDRLTDAQAEIVKQNTEIVNANQTQTLLNAMGRWVAWAGSGSQTPTT